MRVEPKVKGTPRSPEPVFAVAATVQPKQFVCLNRQIRTKRRIYIDLKPSRLGTVRSDRVVQVIASRSEGEQVARQFVLSDPGDPSVSRGVSGSIASSAR
jgi:hypothetical protein